MFALDSIMPNCVAELACLVSLFDHADVDVMPYTYAFCSGGGRQRKRAKALALRRHGWCEGMMCWGMKKHGRGMARGKYIHTLFLSNVALGCCFLKGEWK